MQSNFFGILTPTTPEYTVGDGFDTTLYDTTGNHWIEVAEGGQLSLLGVQGNNTIRLHGNSSLWQVQRDGSTAVFIKTTNGKRVEVPATLEEQTVKFNNGEVALRVDNSGSSPQVKLGEQVLETTLSAAAPWGTDTTIQAPWTLVMSAPHFFSAAAGEYMHALYLSDGTAGGSVLIGDISPGRLHVSTDKTGIIASGRKYSAMNNWYEQSTIFKTNGTAAGTTILVDTSYIDHAEDFQFGDAVIFGNGLATDGSFVTQVVPLGYPSNVLDGGNGVFWHPGHTGPYGSELYRTVIAANGVTQTMVKDISPGSGNGYENGSGYFVISGGKVVFWANETTTSYSSSTPSEYWITDGTEAGTQKLADSLGFTGTNLSGVQRFVSEIAFSASTTTSGNELFVTANGTSVLLDIEAGSGSSNPNIVGEVNGKLCFAATTTAGGRGLYSSNGTSFTRLGDYDYDYQNVLGTVGGQIFMTATKGNDMAIYATDGTTLNHLADVGSSNNVLLAWDSAQAFFSVTDSSHGRELWAANLSTGAFGLVKDILSGTGSALPEWNNDYTLVNGKLAFNAYTTATQQGYYLSDGTSAGTIKIGNAAVIDHEVISDALVFGTDSGVYSVSTTSATPTVTTLSDNGITYNLLQSDADQVFFQTKNGNLYAAGGAFTSATALMSHVQQFKVFEENAIYAIQWASTDGATLWYSDGTASGTHYVTDLGVDNPDSYNLWGAVAIKTVGHSDWVI